MRNILIVALLALSGNAVAASHVNKKVSLIHSGDTRDCLLFSARGSI